MIAAVWGDDLATTVVAVILKRPQLARRLALAPRRVLHVMSAFICHCLQEDRSTASIAADLDVRDIRHLLRHALPNAHPRLYRQLDKVTSQSMPLAFYQRLNKLLYGPASNILLDSKRIHPHFLGIIEQIESDPVLLAAQKAIGTSEGNLHLIASVLAFLRTTKLASEIESLPVGSGWNAIERRIEADFRVAVAPPLPFRCPAGWRWVQTMADLLEIGKRMGNCIAGLGGGGDGHFCHFVTGGEVFLVSDSEPLTLAAVRNLGSSLWTIQEVGSVPRRGRSAPLPDLFSPLRMSLLEIGHFLLETSPASALEAISWRVDRNFPNPGANEEIEAAA